MNNFLKHIALIGLFSFCFSVSQAQINPQEPRIAPISSEVRGNSAQFHSDTPPLHQISGAPKAHYTYYWEFGDGDYSFEKDPKHEYKKKGEYTVRLWSTNNYDTGRPPKSRPEKVNIEKDMSGPDLSALDNKPSVFPENENLIIKTNRDPSPDEEMVLITSYKNTKDYETSGVLYVFYNDKKFKNNNFKLEDTRLYHNEKIIEDESFIAQTELNNTSQFIANNMNEIWKSSRIYKDSTKNKDLPLLIEKSKELFRNHQAIEFDNMKPGEERNILRTLKTTPEMIKDTSAIVTLRTIYVPDQNYGNHNVKDTELEIVTSHDPNKMSSSGNFMSYRFAKNKKIKFKVKFQNDGEGPAHTIRLETDTPEMFDKSTLEITDMYPECSICPKGKQVSYSCLDTILKKDKIIFTFKNIYLPGSNQENMVLRDSTKGFVKYTMQLGEKLEKQKTKSRTAIYFDKNEPIYTNYSTTWFRPGISIGAKAGYIYTPSKDKSREYFAGITVSPYKPRHGYLQAEFYISAASFKDIKKFSESSYNAIDVESKEDFIERSKENNITAYLVPVSYRYNFNRFIALGVGAQLQLDFQSKINKTKTGEAFLDIPGEDEIRDEYNDSYQESECTKHFGNFNAGAFFDLSLGNVKIGPSIGFRYVLRYEKPSSQLQVYAVWKF